MTGVHPGCSGDFPTNTRAANRPTDCLLRRARCHTAAVSTPDDDDEKTTRVPDPAPPTSVIPAVDDEATQVKPGAPPLAAAPLGAEPPPPTQVSAAPPVDDDDDETRARRGPPKLVIQHRIDALGDEMPELSVATKKRQRRPLVTLIGVIVVLVLATLVSVRLATKKPEELKPIAGHQQDPEKQKQESPGFFKSLFDW